MSSLYNMRNGYIKTIHLWRLNKRLMSHDTNHICIPQKRNKKEYIKPHHMFTNCGFTLWFLHIGGLQTNYICSIRQASHTVRRLQSTNSYVVCHLEGKIRKRVLRWSQAGQAASRLDCSLSLPLTLRWCVNRTSKAFFDFFIALLERIFSVLSIT